MAPLAVARPTARICLEAMLPSRGRRYTRGPDRGRWPYDLRFSDTSHQDAKSYASAYACAVPLMIHPTPFGLVRDHAVSLDEKIINLSEAQRGRATRPDRPSHDFGRTPLSVVADFLLCFGERDARRTTSPRRREHPHRSTFAMIAISAPRARARRDITVPAGAPVTSAISR
jgi:hypothetical protein